MSVRHYAATARSRQELVITRLVDAPRSLVFRAWTEAESLVRWAGLEGFTTTSGMADLRPGGRFRLCMRSPDGAERRLEGVYREIVEPERLVFTVAWGDEPGAADHPMLVKVAFAEEGAKTRLTLRQSCLGTATERQARPGSVGDYPAIA